MKRNEGECFYDYQARRLLEEYRLAILKLGLPVQVDGTYVNEHRFPGQRKLSKLEKKKMKKARRKLKYRLQAQAKQEELRGCSGYVPEPLIVSP